MLLNDIWLPMQHNEAQRSLVFYTIVAKLATLWYGHRSGLPTHYFKLRLPSG